MAKQAKQPVKTEIVALIKESPKRFAPQDIERWKNAIRQFDNRNAPLRMALYEMYDNVMLDGQIEATWGKRRDSILNKRLIFKKDGVEDEEITALLNSPDFRQIVEEIHKSIIYGYTLIQVNNIYFDDVEEMYKIDYDLIPREHVHPEREWECVSKEAGQVTRDFLFRSESYAKYMIYAGNPIDKGLLIKAAPYIIYKRGAMGDWSQFCEMFGMPLREATYEGFDEDSRKRIEDLMEQWGAGMSFVHPNTVKVELHDTNGNANSADVYRSFIAICDALIAKTILGNTLTTEQGEKGTQALGRIHEQEQESKEQSDQNFVLSILNTRAKAILKTFGFNVTGGNIWFETGERDWEQLGKKWNVISAISDKIPVDDDFIYTEFDIPKPENYEEMREEMRIERIARTQNFTNNLFDGRFFEDAEVAEDKKTEKKGIFGLLRSFFEEGQ